MTTKQLSFGELNKENDTEHQYRIGIENGIACLSAVKRAELKNYILNSYNTSDLTRLTRAQIIELYSFLGRVISVERALGSIQQVH